MICFSCGVALCSGCLQEHIKLSEEADVLCPCQFDDANCEASITEREIREVISNIMSLQQTFLISLKGNSHQKLSVANVIELLLKSFFGVSLAYVQSLEGSQKAG